MKILFYTKQKDAPSTTLNLQALRQLTCRHPEIELDEFIEPNSKHDLVLLMGYDHEINKVRLSAPNAAIGVIDVRPKQKSPTGADFLVVNGQEMADWCINFGIPIFYYPIFPQIEKQLPKRRNAGEIFSLGYHGNLIHLNNFGIRAGDVLKRLSKHCHIKLIAVYNIAKLGKWSPKVSSKNLLIEHVQWSENSYLAALTDCHLGIVPSFIAHSPELKVGFRNIFKKNLTGEMKSDYMCRFKATANAGRAFVFAQMGIPVVADAIPSICNIIKDGWSGYSCLSMDKWEFAINNLMENDETRVLMAQRFQDYFYSDLSRVKCNEIFAAQLKDIIEKKKKAFLNS